MRLPAVFAWLLAALTSGALAETRIGKTLTLQEPMSVSKLLEAPDSYVGRTVQVKGKVTATCDRMGCWMNLRDGKAASSVRVKVNDGELVFPKSAVGRMAIAEGRLTKIERTREQAIAAARHEAEEQGREFDPATVRSGSKTYQIAGVAAIILD